ncbi:transcription factor Zelda isoform X2 [Bombus flavifrons]|uniref:transcription factor Zelda isoform X2 n=1 Tax=Bombus flavifrons TaxID=103934 RepID=UPI003704D198
MSEMTSVEKQQQQQQQQRQQQQQQQEQQYVGGSSNSEHHCKDCGLYFESDKSLEVHLRYHQENLLSQWANQAQQEESNNNNSKAGNHNSHVGVRRDSVTAPADSSESSSRPPSQDPTSSSQHSSTQQQQSVHQQQQVEQQQQQQQQQQAQQQQAANQNYNHFQTSMYGDNYFMQNDQAYMLSHHYSPPREDNGVGGGGGSYSRYHPYQHQQHFPPERANSVSSTSPRSPPIQCEKCGAVYEDANQLGEHVRTSHSNSPGGYPGQHQYQQLGNSPQQQNQQQMHASPPQSSQQQQQSGYDYNGRQPVKLDITKEPDEQAEILDLDSHKVQTHRYEDELIRMHQQQQQELQIQMHQQQVMQQQHHQQQRAGAHSVSSMLAWPPAAQPHDYHPGLSPMIPMDSISPLSDQNQFIRGQHMPVEAPRHPNSPIITSTQPMPGHQIPGGLLQQPPKPPPLANQSWKSNEARRPKTYNCTACNKWFTSSGHLKRHYNTTLHKNAVKQSNQPDPANLPISAHHHPGRDSHSSGRGGGQSRSPELSSSGSPPNLMAGPSGEAARGLLHTPTNLYNNNNNNSNSSSSSESSAITVAGLTQQSPTAVHLGSTMVPAHISPVESPLAAHHQQQMGSPSSQLGHQQQQQQQQQLHHLPMGSPSGQLPVHPMNSPMSPMHPPLPPHLSSPSPMGSHPHHHMNSPSPITPGSVHPAMASPTAMGGTTMPHQPYPNALPPHVTTTTNIPGLLESITIQLTTTGNETSLPLSDQSQHQQQNHHEHQQQQQQQEQLQSQDVLPGFGTFSNHQRLLPSFTEFNVTGFMADPNQSEAINVGGLSPEENVSPQDGSFESSESGYSLYRSSPPRYQSLTNVGVNTDGMIIKRYEVQTHFPSQPLQQTRNNFEANNNLPRMMQAKEELNPNVGRQIEKDLKLKGNFVIAKEHQVTSTFTGSHYISQDGFHKCIECDKIFNKACYLTQHNKSFHSGDKPYKCNQCGKRFTLEYLHAEHLLKHAGDKPYKCEICPKQFNHKTDLRRHMCLHTGEKPYACDTCGKGFIRKDHMMKHLETHRKKNNHNVHLRT